MKLALPPPENWQDFESLCRDLWAKLWNDPNAKKHGRTGQKQFGVDVYGQPAGGWEGVQCKRYERDLTRKEIEHEVEEARKFEPGLQRLILATTTKRDTSAQKLVREISRAEVERKLFPVDLWSWDDIADEVGKDRDLLHTYYPKYVDDPWPQNLPYPSLHGLFKGREAMLAALMSEDSAVAITQPQVCMGWVASVRRGWRWSLPGATPRRFHQECSSWARRRRSCWARTWRRWCLRIC